MAVSWTQSSGDKAATWSSSSGDISATWTQSSGDIQKKEYYMREFWKKVGDDQSNKRRIFVNYPITPFAIK